MICVDEYRKNLALKLIGKFKQEFESKTEMNISVKVEDLGIDEIDRKFMVIPTLEDLERYFIDCLPASMVKNQALRLKCRKRENVDIRTIFTAIALNMRFSLVSIGRHINRDHTTIIHMRQRAKDLFETDPSFYSLYLSINEKIQNKYAETIQ